MLGHLDGPASAEMLGGDLGDIEGFPGELRNEPWVDPRCAGAGLDFLGSAVGRDDGP